MKQLFNEVKIYHTATNYDEILVCKKGDWDKFVEKVEKKIGRPEKGDIIYCEDSTLPKKEISSLLKVKFTDNPKDATVFLINIPKCLSEKDYNDLWDEYYADEHDKISEPNYIISYSTYYQYKDGYSVNKMKTSKGEEYLIHLDDIEYEVNELTLNSIHEKISKGENFKILNEKFFFEKYDEEMPEELFAKLGNMLLSNDRSFHKLGIGITLAYSYEKNKAKITALLLSMNTDGDKTYNKMKDYATTHIGYGGNNQEDLIKAYLEHPTEAMSKIITKKLLDYMGVQMEGIKIKFEK